MFILKSTHSAIVENLQKEISLLKFFNENDAAAHDMRVQDLQSRIADLKQLVFPPRTADITREAREVDAVLSASEKAPELSESELNRILEGQREQDLIFSGNYDTDLVS